MFNSCTSFAAKKTIELLTIKPSPVNNPTAKVFLFYLYQFEFPAHCGKEQARRLKKHGKVAERFLNRHVVNEKTCLDTAAINHSTKIN